MAGTRTAPVVTGAASNVNVTLHLMDASGDLFTENVVSTVAPTAAQIEAWAAAYQAASQSTLYKVSTTSVWEGEADPDNATTGDRDSVADGVNQLFKNISTLKSQTLRLIAPIPAVMQGNQDIPLATATEFAALIAAELAILSGYTLQSVQFTERKERKNNPKIKV